MTHIQDLLEHAVDLTIRSTSLPTSRAAGRGYGANADGSRAGSRPAY